LTEGVFTKQRFTTHGERVERVLEEVLARMPADAAWRVLDIGCADGGTLFALADSRHEASFVGIDLSLPSIAAAESLRESLATTPGRFSFVAGDYLTTPLEGPFDLVIADQSLYLIEGQDDALARRLAGDLSPGGLLLAEMPYAGAFNRALVALRRVLRRVRGPALDRAGRAIARRLHPDMPDEQLEERLVYLYVVPERLASGAWELRLAAHGLDRVAQIRMRHASPAQLRHDLRVYRKR
jgi:trans-aconitate 2-methyltransferase